MLQALIPMLESDDLRKTLAFYRDVLGFELIDCDESEDNLNWMMIRKDNVELMFASRFMNTNGKPTGCSGTLYMYPDDVDAWWDTIHEKVEIAWPIQDFEYGMREFGIVDPNGYLLSFGASIDSN